MLTDSLVLLGGWNTWLKHQPIFEYVQKVANSRHSQMGDYIMFEGGHDGSRVKLLLAGRKRITVQQGSDSISFWEDRGELDEIVTITEDGIAHVSQEKTELDTCIFGDILSPEREEVHLFSVVYGEPVLRRIEKFYKVILSLNSLVTTGRGLPHEFL